MSSPYPPFGSADVHDDDGQVIDSLFKEVDDAPSLAPATQTIPVTPIVEPTPLTRMLSGFQTMTTGFTDPFQLLPPDARRKELILRVRSFAATPDATKDYVKIGYRRQDLISTQSDLSGLSFKLRSGEDDYSVFHTGAVWVAVESTLTGNIEITWHATIDG